MGQDKINRQKKEKKRESHKQKDPKYKNSANPT